jgi:hypothetical protein
MMPERLKPPPHWIDITDRGITFALIGAEGYRRQDLHRRRAYHEASHVACALQFGIPVISVTIAADTPHMHRGHYRPPPSIGLEAMVTLYLAGPVGEQHFCGAINDGSDAVDYAMAREYLADGGWDALQVEAKIKLAQDAADRLVRTPAVQDRIRLLAAALMRHGTLTGGQISELQSAPPPTV